MQQDLEVFLGGSQEQWNDKVMEQLGHESSTEIRDKLSSLDAHKCLTA